MQAFQYTDHKGEGKQAIIFLEGVIMCWVLRPTGDSDIDVQVCGQQ